MEKRAAMEAELAADLGGNLSMADRIMLARAVELLCRRPRSHDDAVRLTNAATRILQALRAKHVAEDTVPSLSEYEAASL
jgi:hypothetical protein